MGALLCDPAAKDELENRNGVEQLAYIEYVVNTGARRVGESHILELQRLAVQDIYPCAGSYRIATRDVHIEGSPHQVPPVHLVPSLVIEMVDWINSPGRSALERAAYALWRLNWIHPFSGGNGRTSRAIAYLIVCLGSGRMLPGKHSMPSLIYQERRLYIKALQEADEEIKKNPDSPNLNPIVEFLRRMLVLQMASAIHELQQLS